jgi:glutamate synthase (NADPH/NADH) large chain
VYDPTGDASPEVNREMVDLDPLDDDDAAWLHDRRRTRAETGSEVAAGSARGLGRRGRTTKVMPKDYKRVLEADASEAEERASTRPSWPR